jgi:hypothetical protein
MVCGQHSFLSRAKHRLRTVCFSFDGLLHASNSFGEEGNLGSHGDRSKKGQILERLSLRIGTSVELVAANPKSSLSLGWFSWSDVLGWDRRGKAAEDVFEHAGRWRVTKSPKYQCISARRDETLRFTYGLATQMASCYLELKMATVEEALRAKTWCKAVDAYVISRGV